MPNNSKKADRLKCIIWLAMSIPAVVILWRFNVDAISYGQVIHQTGLWSTGLLALALAVTPFRALFRGKSWPLALQRHRRAIGVASFGYAALHTATYLERKWGYGYIWKEAQSVELGTGWIAFAIFLALAVTSNDASVRLLKRRWKTLHRWVYLATALVFAHWVLTAVDPMTPSVCAILLALGCCARWWPSKNPP